jgi:hypothetical protein
LPLLALLVTPFSYYQDITGRNFAFRTIVEIVTCIWIALALLKKEYRPPASPILAAFGLFIVIMAIADIFGVDPYKSFWGNFERMDGWVTLAHVFAIVLVAPSIIKRQNTWRWLFTTSVIVSGIVAIYGLLQIPGYIPLEDPHAAWAGWNTRIDSLIGNPQFLGEYLLLHIFLAVFLLAQTWNGYRKPRDFFVSLGFGSIVVVDAFALLFTGTRGPILGLVIGVFATLALCSVTHTTRKIRNVALVSLIAIMMLGGTITLLIDPAQ